MSAETTDHEPDSDSSPLLSADQVGEKLNISGRCVLNWFYDKIIPAAIHQGKVIRFREADVMAALEEARKDSGTASGQAIPEDVLRLAFWLMAPDAAEPPVWMHTREPSRDEESTASKFAVAYSKAMRDLETVEKRRDFIHSALRANNILRLPK
jgi:hypothetical protein